MIDLSFPKIILPYLIKKVNPVPIYRDGAIVPEKKLGIKDKFIPC